MLNLIAHKKSKIPLIKKMLIPSIAKNWSTTKQLCLMQRYGIMSITKTKEDFGSCGDLNCKDSWFKKQWLNIFKDVVSYCMWRLYDGIGSCVWRSHKQRIKIVTWAISGKNTRRNFSQSGVFLKLWHFIFVSTIYLKMNTWFSW